MRKICILILLFCFICSNPYIPDSQSRGYDIEQFNIYDEWFVEPVESIYFIWLGDGNGFKFTSGEWDRVSGSPVEGLAEMRMRGYDMSTCSIVIHNHIIPTPFSPVDKRLYWLLKDNGFRGAFLLYTSRGVFILKDE